MFIYPHKRAMLNYVRCLSAVFEFHFGGKFSGRRLRKCFDPGPCPAAGAELAMCHGIEEGTMVCALCLVSILKTGISNLEEQVVEGGRVQPAPPRPAGPGGGSPRPAVSGQAHAGRPYGLGQSTVRTWDRNEPGPPARPAARARDTQMVMNDSCLGPGGSGSGSDWPPPAPDT